MRPILIAFSISSLAITSHAGLVSDGFDYPLGPPNASGYKVFGGDAGLGFKERFDYQKDGFPEYHPGEDWNDDNSGLDYGADKNDAGDPVYAPSNGVVQFARFYRPTWGHIVLIEHTAPPGLPFTIPESTTGATVVWSQFGHMASIAANPRTGHPWQQGDDILRGEQIGTVGDYPSGTGKAFHLHFELRKAFRAPFDFVYNSFSDASDFQPWSQVAIDRYYIEPTAFILSNRTIFPSLNQPPRAGFLMSSGSQTASDAENLRLQVPVSCNVPEDGNANGTVQVSFSAEPPPANPPLSFDPDGTIVDYEWKFTDSVVFRGPNFVGTLGCGDHLVTLTVTDNRGSQAMAQGNVKVTEPSGASPTLLISTASCAEGASCSGPAGTTFNLRGVGFTPSGSIKRFIVNSRGVETELLPLLSAGGTGQVEWTFESTCATDVGEFALVAVDQVSGRRSNFVTEIHQPGRCPLTKSLFFDGTADPAFANASFDEPVIDSHGNLILVSTHSRTSCGFGHCGIKLHSIAPNGEPSWSVPPLSDPNSYIYTDAQATAVLANNRTIMAPTDRVYVLGRDTIHGYESDGSQAIGWPVDLGGGGSWFFSRERGAIVDHRDGTVYARIQNTVTSPGFATSVAAIKPEGISNPTGAERWRNNYTVAGGSGTVQGPARDIYFMLSDQFVALDHGSGNQICGTTQVLAYDKIVGGLESVFTSFRENVTSFNANCGDTRIFSSPQNDVQLLGVADSRLLGIETSSTDPTNIRLVGIATDGTSPWRNSRISPDSRLKVTIKFDTIYILGLDRQDSNTPKLFFIDVSTGTVLGSFETTSTCAGCGVAIAEDGTLYISDLNSTKVWKLK